MNLNDLFESKMFMDDDEREDEKENEVIKPTSPKVDYDQVELFDKLAKELTDKSVSERPDQTQSVEKIIDKAQDKSEESESPFPDEPQLEIEIEDEPGTWYHEFETKILGAHNLKDYLNLLKEKSAKIWEKYQENNQDLDQIAIDQKSRQLIDLRKDKESDIGSFYEELNKAREIRTAILRRDGPYAVSREEADEQSMRDARRRLGAAVTGTSGYETRINNALKQVDQKILSIKKELYEILRKFPGRTSGLMSYVSIDKTKETTGRKADPAKSKVIKGLDDVLERSIKMSGQMFVDDPDGLEQYIAELKQDYFNYSKEIIALAERSMNAKEIFNKSSDEQESKKHYEEWFELSQKANQLLAEFKKKYDPEKQEKPLAEADFRDQQWYSNKYREYLLAASTLPGSPPSIGDSLKNLADRSKFISSSAKYPDINQVIDDRSLISQVIRGVKPIAHTKTFRREVRLNREESQQVAYVVAPEQMGGGVIWYRPEQRAGERPYDERILGLNPELDKEDRVTTKPYNPMSKDANLNIVELYIWNNLANKSDPKLYNFINGLCLGYPRDYVIWFCESEYGQTDQRKPEQSFWGRMLERFRYCLNAGVNGYGRPGSIKPDGMFSSVFKFLTPDFVNGWINRILGTSAESLPHESFASAIEEFEPVRAPEKTKFNEDPVIESIYQKLDNL